MNLFKKAKKVSSNLLRQFGVKATFQRVIQGKFNPATGRVEGSTTLEWQAYAVLSGIDLKNFSGFGGFGQMTGGTKIESGDMTISVDVQGGQVPKVGDTVTIAGGRWQVVEDMPVMPAGEVIAYKGIIRRG